MGSIQSSAEDSCFSDTDDEISEPPKEIRKLPTEEPATAVVPVGGNTADRSNDGSCSDTEVTGPSVKIPNLDETATPWKESTSELCNVTRQQSSTSTAHEGDQVKIVDMCSDISTIFMTRSM